MLSGRYITDQLSRHWTTNKSGTCLLQGCIEAVGSLEHILLHCPALDSARQKMFNLCLDVAKIYPPVSELITLVLNPDSD